MNAVLVHMPYGENHTTIFRYIIYKQENQLPDLVNIFDTEWIKNFTPKTY